MTIKNFTKLSLSALLLAAATHSAIAEAPAEPKVVKLGDGTTTISWSEFVSRINDPSTIPANSDDKDVSAAKDALDAAKGTYKNDSTTAVNAAAATKAAQATYDASLAEYNNKSRELSTQQSLYSNAVNALALENNKNESPDWLTTSNTNAETISQQYQDAQGDMKFYYKIEKATSGRITNLDICFIDLEDKTGWTEIDQQGFYEKMVDSSTASISFNNVRIYLGPKCTSGNYPGVTYSDKASILGNCATTLQSFIDNKTYKANQSKIEELTKESERLQKVVEDLTKEVEAFTTKGGTLDTQEADIKSKQALQDTAEETASTSKQAMDTAQATYDKALQASKEGVEKNYKNVILTDDVTANEAIVNFDGTFEGDGHVINLSGIDNLFTRLTGANVMNVAVNGNIFNTQSNAAFTRVAAWRGSNGIYYDENGTITSNIGTIGELGFIAREKFGADFDNEQLAALTDDTRVYSITIYNVGNTVPAYVHKDNNGFYNATADYRNSINTFIKSETNDFGDLPNVFVTDRAGNSTCENVVITDKNNFYCPFDIKATKMSYIREFKAGENTVCLPFKLEETANPNIKTLCRYERETTDKFYFKKIAGSIPANTPFLLFAENPFTFETFGETTIKQTPAEQIVMDAGNAEDPSKCFGTLKKTGIQEFLGKYNANKIYVLSGSKFKPADPEASSAAFRLAIASELGANNNVQRAPRLIGILDEKGIEITDDIITGVENVAEETSALNIAGGQGEIVITSDADYGKVEVYTMAGGVAAVADVMAGTTSVSLQKGIYIVMGKKVMVK